MLDLGTTGRRRERSYSAIQPDAGPRLSAVEATPAQPRTFQGNVRALTSMLLKAAAVSVDPLSAFERSKKPLPSEATPVHGNSPANGPTAKSLLGQATISLANITLSADTKQDFSDRFAGWDLGASNKASTGDVDPLRKAEQIFRSDAVIGDLAIGYALNSGGLSASIARQIMQQQGVQPSLMAQSTNGPSFGGPKTKVRADSEVPRIIVSHGLQLLLATTGLTPVVIAAGLAYSAYHHMRPTSPVVAQAPAPSWERKRSSRHYRH